ncbi:MAG TPA: OmpA family protein [Blastocatellia bacterium]|nr:OmpA family protein [Blastocatellia bacterium]
MRIDNLPHPQELGTAYTSYVIWALVPDGPANNWGRLPFAKDRTTEIELTTPFQTFGMIVTVEPHALVQNPGPEIVAENLLDTGAKGRATQRVIEYTGDRGLFYTESGRSVGPSVTPDYDTPLSVLGARRAVEIARRAGAAQFAKTEFRMAQAQLAALEQLWPQYLVNSSKEEELRNTSLDVMRLAESARNLSLAHSGSALAKSEAAIAKLDTERVSNQFTDAAPTATALAAPTGAVLPKDDDPATSKTRYETELAQALLRAEQGVSRAERLEAREEIIRLETERSQSEQTRRERDETLRQWQSGISGVLENRRDSRGLIVNLSEAYFDPDRASLTAEARQKLDRLINVLLKTTSNYQIEATGYVGSGALSNPNLLRLSENRAASVREYFLLAGLPANKIQAAKDLTDARPVPANNALPAQPMKSRVEILIVEAESQASR